MTEKQYEIDRRHFIGLGACALAAGSFVASPVSAAVFKNGRISSATKKVSFRNTHTGESFSGVYRVGNKYLADSFDRISHVLRDFRTNEVFPIDPRVIDIIHNIHKLSGSYEPFEILSGYRSPQTNAMLRRTSTGVARNSLHMTGQALDIRLPGYSTRGLRNLAVKLKAGGVGYYPRSDFVHVDTGDVRSW